MVLLVLLLRCGGNNTSLMLTSQRGKICQVKKLEQGAEILQTKSPLKKVNVYLDGF